MVQRLHLLLFIAISSILFFKGCTDTVTETVAEEQEEIEKEQQPPAQAFGVNVNGQFGPMKFANIERTETIWVRGFLDIFQIFDDDQKLDDDPRIQKFLQLDREGYKTILSLKWDFSNRSFPEPSSAEMEEYKSYLIKLLQRVWKATDIIVIGNEPYIESKQNERGEALLDFYREVGYTVKDFKESRSRNVPIFVGAFNNLYLQGWQTESVRKFLSFVEKSDWIAGVDLHVHHSAIEQLSGAMDYVHPRIRKDQKVLLTEFSLMKHWRSKSTEVLPESFAEAYDWDVNTKNYEYLDYALKNQVPKEEWDDFLSSSYWFENRIHYLQNAYQRLSGYSKFHIATYALRQSYPFDRTFTANTDPWILNGLFANRTVEKHPETGLEQFNYAWMEDFKNIPKDSN